MTEKPLLDVRNLQTSVRLGTQEVPVVDDVSFHVHPGETLAIVGESGSGKSMTSLSLMRLLPKPASCITGGEVWLDDANLVALPENAMFGIRGKDMAMIFQEPMTSLNPVMTIGKQITEILTYHQRLSHSQARSRAVELLRRVGFARAEAMLNEYPHQLSGGMRQRVMIAMAMSCEPKVLIADEPTTALDVTVQAQILNLMRDLVSETRAGMILITHDLGVVAELADRVVVMYAGEVVEEATVDELFDNPTHPYTRGLMDAIPRLDEERERLKTIRGNVPSPLALPKGCRFSTRCPHAQSLCRTDRPALTAISASQSSRCFIHTGDIQLAEAEA